MLVRCTGDDVLLQQSACMPRTFVNARGGGLSQGESAVCRVAYRPFLVFAVNATCVATL
jgi:hypothetical protein